MHTESIAKSDSSYKDSLGNNGPPVVTKPKPVKSKAKAKVASRIGSLIMQRLDEVEEEHQPWLWQDRIPQNALSILAGHGDVGKSTLLYTVASIISRGKDWPNNEGKAPQGSVVIFSQEDSPSHVIKPRIMAADGNTRKIHLPKGVGTGKGKQQGFSLHEDLDKLGAIIEAAGDVRLVIFDPISSYFGGINAWKENQVRDILEPLAKKADEWGVAIIGNAHLGKGEKQGNANLKVLNSVAVTNVARMVNMVARDPEDEELRVFSQTKLNVAKKQPSLQFRFESKKVGKKGVEAARLVWQGVSDKGAGDIVLGVAGQKQKPNAGQWLFRFLSESGKVLKEEDVIPAGLKDGYSRAAIQKAFTRDCGVRFKHEKDAEGKSWWWVEAVH